MSRYAQHFSTRSTPQSRPIPGSGQVVNSNGGYSFPVDDWTRLERFLILGCAEGSKIAAEDRIEKVKKRAICKECLVLMKQATWVIPQEDCDHSEVHRRTGS